MDAPELVAFLRDLSLIMFAWVAVLSLLTVTVLVILLYRKLSPVLDSSRIAAKNAEELSSKLGEKLDRPLNGISSLLSTSSRLLSFIFGISRGKGGE